MGRVWLLLAIGLIAGAGAGIPDPSCRLLPGCLMNQLVPPSQPPIPRGGEPQQQQQTAPSDEHSGSQGTERGTEDRPLFVVRLDDPKNHHEVAANTEDERRWYASPDWWVAIFTGLLFIATSALWIFTWLLWRTTRTAVRDGTQALKLANDEFIAGHRPRLRVRNIVVEPTRPHHGTKLPPLAANQPVIGQLYISNTGSTDAVIIESCCVVYWTDRELPMERPYEGKPVFQGWERFRLRAGGSTPETFANLEVLPPDVANSIARGDGNWQLYVMGWVSYEDAIGTPRRTAYCRRYRADVGRFRAIDDPDYEHEE
jgi:hypothetical protein